MAGRVRGEYSADVEHFEDELGQSAVIFFGSGLVRLLLTQVHGDAGDLVFQASRFPLYVLKYLEHVAIGSLCRLSG